MAEPRSRLDIAEELREIRHALAELSPRAKQKRKRTLNQLAEEWLKKKLPTLDGSADTFEARVRNHLLPVFGKSKDDLDRHAVRAWMLQLELAPQTVNHIRNAGRQLVEYAQEKDEWATVNPFEKCDPLPVTWFQSKVLTEAEVRRLLAAATDTWRLIFAVTVVLGLRRGEVFGLKVEDVDRTRRVLRVCRSHGRRWPKNRRPREIPVPPRAWKVIERALKERGESDYVFPGRNGGRRCRDSKVAKWLRGALVRAGVVEGWVLTCRKKKCTKPEAVDAPKDARCSKCGGPRVAKARAKHLRFHDLRHTSATLHLQAGCHPWVVSKVLGHTVSDAPPAITWRYTHFSEEWVREQLNLLDLP